MATALLVCNLIVFALAAHVNTFHGFFYVADEAPFFLSIFTFLIVGSTFVGDLRGTNPLLSRPRIELPLLALLTLFWLCFNAFSSSRWRFVQAADCGTIPAGDDFSSVAIWCREVQALRSFVWVEWIILAATFVWLTAFTLRASRRGNTRIWSTSLAHATTSPAKSSGMKYINRPSAAFTTGSRSSSFVSHEHDAAFTPQSFGPDFERQSQEHWQNVQHSRNPSDTSSYYSGSQQQQYQQPQQYQQQPPQYQQQQQQSTQPGGYFFGGYGYAQ
ncbi:hypothetical protein EXIGLDRAFT_758463 [Exidia glandulosa HHB12029]|uniref:MARVEL domain-containing protein n=1 Tax=Exidia glandulosa HHB12029 TaxID=1314781 RepID=A0A165QWI9_EXIGL|nr:hypothetical protein EXIGLDRAFT_758463 [Exidia glandulosa HHB12029]